MAKSLEGASGVVSELAGVGEGLFHSTIENPYNGLTQIVNRTGVDLPEMHLVDTSNQNLGFKAGSIAGMAVDFYVLNKIGGQMMGNMGGVGLGGTMLRAGIVGGVFEGVFTPSDPNSKNFLGDRLSSAAVGATTFAAMAGAGGMLGRTGLFVVPEAQSLMQSMTFNGLSGVAGGVAHAEANAVFKQGKALASPGDFLSDGLTYGAFGAAFGAVDNVYNRVFNPLTMSTVESNKASINVYRNAQGEIVKIESTQPSYNTSFLNVKTEAAKNMIGGWNTTSAQAFSKDGSSFGDALRPGIQSVVQTPDGGIRVQLDNGRVRIFNPDGEYHFTDSNGKTPAEVKEADELRWKKMATDRANNGDTDIYGQVRKSMETSGHYDGGMTWNSKGEPAEAWIANGPSFKRVGPDTWDVQFKNAEWTWRGEIKGITAPEGRLQGIQLVPKEGAPVTYSQGEGNAAAQVGEHIVKSAQFNKYSDDYGYLRVGDDGSIYLRGSRWDKPSIGEQKVGLQEVPLKVGEDFSITSDVGDRYPVFETTAPVWARTFQGSPTLNGIELKPGTMLDLHSLRKAH